MNKFLSYASHSLDLFLIRLHAEMAISQCELKRPKKYLNPYYLLACNVFQVVCYWFGVYSIWFGTSQHFIKTGRETFIE